MFGQNISNNFDKNGNFDVVGMASDTLVDVTLNAGAAAVGASAGAVIGSAIFPGAGTVAGAIIGFGINTLINTEFGNPPTSAVGHLKQFVKDPVGSFGKMSGSVGKAISGVGKWFGFGG